MKAEPYLELEKHFDTSDMHYILEAKMKRKLNDTYFHRTNIL